MENKNKTIINAINSVLFGIVGVMAIFLGFPGISPAQAAWYDFRGIEKNEPISLMEQPALIAPDRYTLHTEYHLVTAYNSEVGQCDSTPFHTAIGSHVRHGIVAANWLPIGTMVRFPTYDPDTWYVVEDRMNERFSDRMDIWMEKKADARTFGVRKLAIEVALPVKR